MLGQNLKITLFRLVTSLELDAGARTVGTVEG